MASDEERSVDELFAELPEKWQRALEEVGMGLPELRRIAAGPDGMQRVRRILSEFSTSPRTERMEDGRGSAVWPWGRLLLVAVASIVVCLLLSLFLGKLAGLVGLGLGMLVIWLVFKTPDNRGVRIARFLTAAAYFVTVLIGTSFVNAWYLQVWGVEQTVTLVSPTRQWTHGTSETYCRVRLADGSVHEVIDNKDNCADRVGQTTKAVVDPADHYKPSLGTKSDIGGIAEGCVFLGAAVVLVLTPVTAAVLGRRDRNRTLRTAA